MEVKGTKHIPEEMVLNILWKLTEEEDLARFKCVSKQWCRWIGNIIDTRPRKQRLIVMFVSGYGQYALKTMESKTRQLQDMAVRGAVPWKKPYQIDKIYGSYNGLLLVGGRDDLFLWNPLTRYIEKIFSYWRLVEDVVGGLCFDYSTKEYKVVVAVIYESPGNGDFVAVGSPRNKSWTHIQFPYCPRTVVSGPVLNNRLHWIATYGFFDSPHVIIYFDTKTDRFLELPMPLVGDAEWDYVLGLGVLDGCLCMTRSEDFSGDRAEVLVMKEYGVKESWTVLFRITGISCSGEIVPFFYVDEGKSQVCMKISDRCDEGTDSIIVYDVNRNSQVDTIQSMQHWGSSSVTYEVTSEKPIKGNWEELESRGEAFYTENYGPECITMRRSEHGFWDEVEEETNEFENQQYHSEDYKEEEEWEVPKRSKCKKKYFKCDSVDHIPTSNTFDILGHCQPWEGDR